MDKTQSELNRLLYDARHNTELKDKLLATRNAKDPMNEFCKVSQDLGYNITIGGLFALGQDMNDSKLRSVNGGGVDGIDGWDDAYETFFYSLK